MSYDEVMLGPNPGAVAAPSGAGAGDEAGVGAGVLAKTTTFLVLVSAYFLWSLSRGNRTFFPFVLGGYLLAFFVLRRRGEDPRGMFDRKIWLHETARTEGLLLLFLYGLLISPLRPWLLPSDAPLRALATRAFAALGLPALAARPTLLAGVCYVLVSLAVFELTYYGAHRLLHGNRVLWEFHKVHHSAQVMTPFTSLRQHPVEIAFNHGCQLVTGGLVAAGFHHFCPAAPGLEAMATQQLVLQGLMLFGNSLGHSHVWLSYGPLDRVLVSPVMHQIHHSADPRHHGKNFGFMLAFPDRLFGTAHVPTRREPLAFGLGGGEDAAYVTLRGILLAPFLGAVRRRGR